MFEKCLLKIGEHIVGNSKIKKFQIQTQKILNYYKTIGLRQNLLKGREKEMIIQPSSFKTHQLKDHPAEQIKD